MPSTPESATAAAQTAYSESQATVYDDIRFRGPAGSRIHALERDVLLRALRRLPTSARALEVGCGTGRLLLEARAAGYQVDGLDASPHMLQQLQKKIEAGGGTFEMVVGEAAKVPRPDGSYDFVYAIRLLNQTESPDYALNVVAEMVRLARPGGYVLAEFVNARRPRWGVNRRDTTRLDPRQVAQRGREAGAEHVADYGAFLLSMQAYYAVPGFLTPLVALTDRVLSRLLPRWCSRSYVLLRKKAGQ